MYNNRLHDIRYFALSERQRDYAQKDFSTQPAAPQQDSRLSSQDEIQGGPQGAVPPSSPGAQAPQPQTGVPGLARPAPAWPKSARLLRRSDFQRVYDSGRRIGSPFFTAFALRNSGEASRVGFTTPRALGKAVRRNRIRRRLREAVRRHIAEMGGGWDLVFNPRAASEGATFPELEAAVVKLFVDLRSRRS